MATSCLIRHTPNATPTITSNAKQKPGHPGGTPRVPNEQMMNEVKRSVPNNSSDYKPKLSFVAKHGKY